MNKLVLEKINIPKVKAYPEYEFKPITIGHACENIEKMGI